MDVPNEPSTIKEYEMQIVFKPIIVLIFLLCFSIGISLAQEATENLLPGDASASKAPTDSVKHPSENTDDYIIGTEDVLSISVWGHEQLNSPNTPVAPDGKISLPVIGVVSAAGLTVAQLRASISQLLKKYIKGEPEVAVTVVEFKSQKIIILGEVNTPGTQSFATTPSLVDAIAKAGGYTSDADLSAVGIISKDGVRTTVDMKKYMTTGDRSLLPNLQADDTIFVPKKRETVIIGPDGIPLTMPDGKTPLTGDVLPSSGITITVSGGVKKPGRYYFLSQPTVVAALTRADWVNSEFALKSVRVIRGNPTKGGYITIDVDKFLRTGNYSLLPQLESGDIIYVPQTKRVEQLKQQEISVLGAVKNPGIYQVDGRISLLDALALAGGFEEKADPKKIRITREFNNAFGSRDVSVQEFISGNRQNLNPSAVPKLMPGDAVVVPVKKHGFLSLVNTTKDVATVIVSVATLYSLYQIVAK